MPPDSPQAGNGLRVLLVNFEMDPHSPVLAWQWKVAERLAARCERVVVLTERAAEIPGGFPATVCVIPRLLTGPLRVLGAKWLVNLLAFHLLARHRLNVGFVHMSMEWAYRLAPAFGLRGVATLLWYAHGSVPDNLRRAEQSASIIVTSSREGFRLPSTKVRVIGQGIDVDAMRLVRQRSQEPRLIYVGRVSRRKRIELLVQALALLKVQAREEFCLRVVGPTLNTDDRRYAGELRDLAARLSVADRLELLDPVAPSALSALYEDVFLHVSASNTGSMDKTVLEALATGCPVLTTNEAYREMLAGFGTFLPDPTPEAFAAAIRRLYVRPPDPQECRDRVVGHHDLDSYVGRILACLEEIAPARPGVSRRVPVPQV